MKIIGVTGTTGSGKSTFCRLLSKYGIKVIDCDKIYNDVTLKNEDCLSKLKENFPVAVDGDGNLNKKKLSAIVFSNKDKLQLLNDITHPFVLETIGDMIKEYAFSHEKAVVVDIPLLFESGFDKKCDVTVAVIAPYEKKLLRLKERSKLSEEEISLRLQKQKNEEFLKNNCNFVVENDSDIESLEKKAADFFKNVLLESI